jgi:hypothetical protein
MPDDSGSDCAPPPPVMTVIGAPPEEADARAMLRALLLSERDRVAAKHWPDGMAFDAEHEDLLRRGWPDLRILDDDLEANGRASAAAKKALDALDPPRVVRWPREVARLFVHGFAARYQPHKKQKLPATAAPIDEAVLGGVLERMGGLGYDFLMRDSLLLCEAFLGPETCAERALAAIEGFEPHAASDRPALWALVVVSCLEQFLLRADDPARVADAEDRLRRQAERLAGTTLGSRLAITLDGASAHREHKSRFHYNVSFLTIDEAYFAEYLAHEYADWLYTPQLARVAGPALAPKKLAERARRDPAWKQAERCVAYGCIRHAFVVELMAGMLGSKGAAGMPEAWLAAHLGFARPTLEQLLATRHPQAAAIAALLGQGPAAAPPKKVTSRQLDAIVKRAFAALSKELPAARGDRAREAAAIRRCVHAIMEGRAARGDIMPEAHVGHILMVDGWGKLAPPLQELGGTQQDFERWGELITDATRS